MTNTDKGGRVVIWLLAGIVALGVLLGGGYFAGHALFPTRAETPAQDEAAAQPAGGHKLSVTCVLPHSGGMTRTSTQPGSVQAFETVELFAGVSGYLKEQTVDIGDTVKKGDILAKVDVPELEKQVQRNIAVVEQSRARVTQMQARAKSARSEWEAARAAVPRAEALLKSKSAELRYRQQQLQRMRDLAASHSIEDKVVDETTSHRDSVREAEVAAQEGVTSAKATVDAMAAKIGAADADVAEAEAEVKVAQADLEKSEVLVKFATVPAPFVGVITQRNFFPSDYVRAANEGSGHLPLLTIQRTDKMRVVVQVPDRDVPYCHPGNQAYVEVDALPGEKFAAKVSRISQTEDAQTRLMHVEIDVPNASGKLCQGMYGRVTIALAQSKDVLSLPSDCLAGKSENGKAVVFVVRDGHAHRVAVSIGSDNGVNVEILGGLKPDDHVIRHPAGVNDGASVESVVQAVNDDTRQHQDGR
jgi:RND family efflux transporter MFP subunit